MRWQALFDDLEGQLEAAGAAELAAEVAERSRREAALVSLADRLRAALGTQVLVHVPGSGPLRGHLTDCGASWLLLEADGGAELLVPVAAVLGLVGVGARAAPPDDSAVGRHLDLRWALRAIARDRTAVTLGLRDGSALTGTLDRVGLDHVDVAEHPLGEPRRASAVRQVRLVPVDALVVVRRG
jgi:hypothetical protein